MLNTNSFAKSSNSITNTSPTIPTPSSPDSMASSGQASPWPQHKFSLLPAHEYGERFLAFLKAVMRGEGCENLLPKDEREKGKDKEVGEEDKPVLVDGKAGTSKAQ